MNDKIIELENTLIVEYPARLQKDKYSKMQFKEYPAQDAIEFNIKLANGSIMTFACKLEDGKIYHIACKLDNKKSKKIKDVIKFIDYMIENA